jgi:hypothetical protein
MRSWNEALERREAIRMRRRLPCAVWVHNHRYEGTLEEVSAHAVVVRMKAFPPDAGEARLTFSTPNGMDFALRATPVRGHVVAHTLRSLLPPSLVLQVREPSDAWLRWVDAPATCAP